MVTLKTVAILKIIQLKEQKKFFSVLQPKDSHLQVFHL